MDEQATDPTRDPDAQAPAEEAKGRADADDAGSPGARIGQQDPASDGEDPSPS